MDSYDRATSVRGRGELRSADALLTMHVGLYLMWAPIGLCRGWLSADVALPLFAIACRDFSRIESYRHAAPDLGEVERVRRHGSATGIQ
jgi:hypothetical protein